ncbi:MAG: methylated-DNA--[protein]-cysteine S-methyltransferase [Streptosporangiaceae bacterium]
MTASTLPEHRTHTLVDSPIGPLTLVAGGGALTGLYMDEQRHRPPDGVLGQPDGVLGQPDAGPFAETAQPPDAALLIEAASQLEAYFTGRLTRFDLPLAPNGTPFQHSVWAALRDIPYGETMTYGKLADRIGRPTASRAVGLANGRNPISVIVPCHRVIGADGTLTGYGGGLERKRYLLALERRSVPDGRRGE